MDLEHAYELKTPAVCVHDPDVAMNIEATEAEQRRTMTEVAMSKKGAERER
jgi:hypothetical protein